MDGCSCSEGERSRRADGLPLSGPGEAEDGRGSGVLRGVGGLAEPERVRVDMADLSCGMDDLALLLSDMALKSLDGAAVRSSAQAAEQ